MNNAIFNFQEPKNEPVLEYLKKSPERSVLEKELEHQYHKQVEIPLIIGGHEIRTGNTAKVVMPTEHGHVLAIYHQAGENEARMAIDAALKAREQWAALSWIERGSIFLRAAELISGKYRAVINAATMLGQGKNIFQSEIDAACEVIDYFRFNVYFASQIYNGQPLSSQSVINRLEYRPLEGFIYAVSPFNFTAIAANLNVSVALMGNVTVWKPASTAVLSNYYLMKILHEAGLPGGVINFIPGQGQTISKVVLNHRELAGIHFTGSNPTFMSMWKTVAGNLSLYRSYPKLIGETGGKDFIFAHPSASLPELATAIIRGAFEYQGQKCSAASRAYIPHSLWPVLKNMLMDELETIKTGCVRNFSNFVNAVIDEKSFDNIISYIEKARASNDAEIIAGGKGDKSVGYFIEPTLIVAKNPHFITMEEEIFGPVMTIYIYPDNEFEATLELCDQTSPYALTGSIFANDRYAIVQACKKLRYAAGNFYYNDKPTGAMVGQQPFGGARGSGTNDKAGSALNLLRWTSPRTIKETLVPPVDYRYGYMKE